MHDPLPRLTDMTGIILAGGKSSRMGGNNKAFLAFHGKPLIERTVEVLRDLFPEILIVTNSPLEYLSFDCRIVTDVVKGKGALGGIFSGLIFASNEHCFVTACDLPFLNSDFIRFMAERVREVDIVVPRCIEGFQPLHAFYSRRLIPAMERMIREDLLKISPLFKKSRTLVLSGEILARFGGEERMFLNVNSQEDLDRALSHP